jgi:hypothetical protein
MTVKKYLGNDERQLGVGELDWLYPACSGSIPAHLKLLHGRYLVISFYWYKIVYFRYFRKNEPKWNDMHFGFLKQQKINM